MDKELKELMQTTIIGENVKLSKMIEDIKPIKENRFTDLELEAEKKQEFSLVIYQKQNPIKRFIRNIKISIEKYRIMKHSKELTFEKVQN